MKTWMPVVALPILVAACGSSTSAQAPSRDASFYAATPLQTQSCAESEDARSVIARHPKRFAEFHDAGSPKDVSALGYAAPQSSQGASDQGQATTDESAEGSFPERRAIEALEVLIGTGKAVKLNEGGAIVTLPSDPLFETGTSHLTTSARWQLDDVAAALAAQSGRRLAIRAYTDSLGSGAESTALSLARATAIRDYLVSKGAPADPTIAVEGWGPAHPVADNATPTGRAANRRVEIVIQTPGKAARAK